MRTVLATRWRNLGMIAIIATVVLVVLHVYGRWDNKTHIWSGNTNNDRTSDSNFKGIPLPASFASHYSIGDGIPLNSDALNLFYSSFQCVGGNPGDLGTQDSWRDRQCIFHNVCLHRNGSSSTYIADYFYPSSIQSLSSTVIRSNNKFLALRHGLSDSGAAIQVKLVPMNHLNQAGPNSNIKYLDGTYLMYQILPHGDMNFGHIIFDDAFGLYAILKQFRTTRYNSPNQNHVLVFQSCSQFPNHLNELCVKFTEGIFPTITSHPVRSIDSLFNSSVNSNRICFRELVAGQGKSGAVGWGPNNLHRAQSFSEFRSDLLLAHGINPNIIPKQHHILLVNKNGRRKFTNLDEIYKKMLSTPRYAGIKITIADDFKNSTITQQLELFQTVTIAISPCGGISLLFFFLPRQSVLIVSGYAAPKGDNSYITLRMESQLWDYQSHLRVFHYPVESSDDFTLPSEYDKKNGANVRNYADTIIKTEKLFPLIDQAIITTALKSS